MQPEEPGHQAFPYTSNTPFDAPAPETYAEQRKRKREETERELKAAAHRCSEPSSK